MCSPSFTRNEAPRVKIELCFAVIRGRSTSRTIRPRQSRALEDGECAGVTQYDEVDQEEDEEKYGVVRY